MCAFNLVCPEINGRCWSQDCRSNDLICGWCIKRVFCQFLTESILRAQVTANVTFFNDPVHSCDNLWVTNVLMTKGRDCVCGNALFCHMFCACDDGETVRSHMMWFSLFRGLQKNPKQNNDNNNDNNNNKKTAGSWTRTVWTVSKQICELTNCSGCYFTTVYVIFS